MEVLLGAIITIAFIVFAVYVARQLPGMGLVLSMLGWILGPLGGLLRRQARRLNVARQWRALLNHPDTLIVVVSSYEDRLALESQAEVVAVAVLDTLGTVRYEATSLPKAYVPEDEREEYRATGARPWPEVFRELALILSKGEVLLMWGNDQCLIEQTANRYGLTLPQLAWRNLYLDYLQFRPGASIELDEAIRREGVDSDDSRATTAERVLTLMRAVVGAN